MADRRLHDDDEESNGPPDMKDLNDNVMEMDVGGLDISDEVTAMGMYDDRNLEDPLKPMDITCVSEVRTPMQAVNARPPFVDHKPSWALMSHHLDDEKIGRGCSRYSINV